MGERAGLVSVPAVDSSQKESENHYIGAELASNLASNTPKVCLGVFI